MDGWIPLVVIFACIASFSITITVLCLGRLRIGHGLVGLPIFDKALGSAVCGLVSLSLPPCFNPLMEIGVPGIFFSLFEQGDWSTRCIFMDDG